MFHVVNATHIKVQWDKPFVFPEFDIRNYTLFTSSATTGTTTNETLDASQDTSYPMVHYANNGGVIPQDCVYMNFSLIATNDIGRSTEGFATGGFAIGMLPLYSLHTECMTMYSRLLDANVFHKNNCHNNDSSIFW